MAAKPESKSSIVLFGGTDPEFLDYARTQIIDFVADRVGYAAAKTHLRDFLADQRYQPAPELTGTIHDFSSDERLDLILQANFRLERGYIRWMKGQERAMLDTWPAKEITVVANKEAYETRWAEAGGVLVRGRMVALMNDPVWAGFSPFGVPYEPFDFDGSLRVRGILRADWAKLSPRQAEAEPQPETRAFSQDLEIANTRCDGILRQLYPSAGAKTP